MKIKGIDTVLCDFVAVFFVITVSAIIIKIDDVQGYIFAQLKTISVLNLA